MEMLRAVDTGSGEARGVAVSSFNDPVRCSIAGDVDVFVSSREEVRIRDLHRRGVGRRGGELVEKESEYLDLRVGGDDVCAVVLSFVAKDPECAAIAGQLICAGLFLIKLPSPDVLSGIERDGVARIVVGAEDGVIEIEIACTWSG